MTLVMRTRTPITIGEAVRGDGEGEVIKPTVSACRDAGICGNLLACISEESVAIEVDPRIQIGGTGGGIGNTGTELVTASLDNGSWQSSTSESDAIFVVGAIDVISISVSIRGSTDFSINECPKLQGIIHGTAG